MKITLENTLKITYLKLGMVEFPACVWQGESGIAVQAPCARNFKKLIPELKGEIEMAMRDEHTFRAGHDRE
jgi:hypothetical protein